MKTNQSCIIFSTTEKKTSTKGLIEISEKAVMAEDPGDDLAVRPQQLIGGINGNYTTLV